jgi:hypothetical protein
LKKGAVPIKEPILEAQQMAVEKHNGEFRSNLWVGKYEGVSKLHAEFFLIYIPYFPRVIYT